MPGPLTRASAPGGRPASTGRWIVDRFPGRTTRGHVLRIAVDGMGGDNAPAEIVAGASEAAREYGLELLLVGLPAAVQPLLESHPQLRFVPATQVIGMDEHPAQAIRQKKDY